MYFIIVQAIILMTRNIPFAKKGFYQYVKLCFKHNAIY